LFLFKEIMQMLRFAQHDKTDFFTRSAAVGHKTPPASRAPRPPRLIRLTPMGQKPWGKWPPPPFVPLPRVAGEGAGGGGRTRHPRLLPWAKLCRPLRALTSLTNF
jgi:hypothetical protein